MNFVERQGRLQRELLALSVKTVAQMAAIQRAALGSYCRESVELVRTLVTTRDLAAVGEAQRAFSRARWADLRRSMRARAVVLGAAVEQTGQIYVNAFARRGGPDKAGGLLSADPPAPS